MRSETSNEEEFANSFELPDHDHGSLIKGSNPTNYVFDCEQQGLAYIAGYLAYLFPQYNYGVKSKDFSKFADVDNSPWISLLSRGGLMKPKEDFLKEVVKMENEFRKFHDSEPGGMYKGDNVIKSLHVVLDQILPELPSEVLFKFSKTRTHIRIKYLNNARRDEQAEKRRNQKKIQHFTS